MQIAMVTNFAAQNIYLLPCFLYFLFKCDYDQIFYYLQDMYQLHQYIQESLAREQLLEAKLLGLQRLVQETEAASQLGWKALMDEDRLLTRFVIIKFCSFLLVTKNWFLPSNLIERIETVQ